MASDVNPANPAPEIVSANAADDAVPTPAPAANPAPETAQAPNAETAPDSAQAPNAETAPDSAQAPDAETAPETAQAPHAETVHDSAQAPDAGTEGGAEQPSLSDLSPDDRAWITENVSRAQAMGVDFDDPATLQELFDGALDDVRIGAQNPAIRNDVIGVVAVALGQTLARRHNVEWHKFADANGTELCLHEHATGWVLMPISAV